MKKLIAIVLILIMCLSISACGKKADETAPKETIPETTGNENIATEEDTEGESVDPEIEALKALIPGEWARLKYNGNDIEKNTATFKKDGSVVLDTETELTWEVFSATKDLIVIHIKDGTETLYTAKLTPGTEAYDLEYYKTIPCMIITIGNTGYPFFRMSDYTAHEITMDNWSDFFEIKEVSTVEKDAFGEITKIGIGRYLVLKEEYVVNAMMSQVFIEYSSNQVKYSVTADKATGEYTIGDVVDNHDNWTPTKLTMNTTHQREANNQYGIHIGTSYVTKFPTCEIDIRSNFEVSRVAGTLYVFNTAK